MTVRSMLSDVRRAVSLLTIVPTDVAWPEEGAPGVAAWFPAVGLALGAAGWGFSAVLTASGWRGSGALVVGAVIVGGWAALTRFLHWDGLADVADGLWGAHTPERRLEIMSDSLIGAFGATAIAIVACASVGAVASLAVAGQPIPLLVAPAIGRLAATFAAWLGTPAKPGGLGRTVMGRPSAAHVAVAVATVAACVAGLYLTFGIWGGALSVAGIVVAAVVPHLLSGRVGGVTGDIMGASVLVTETFILAAAAVMWGA